MKNEKLKNRGIIEIVTIVIIGVAALAYFNVDLHAIVNDPFIQKIFGILKGAWFNYLLPLGGYIKVSISSLFN